MRGNYPSDFRLVTINRLAHFRCPACGHTWRMHVYTELGTSWYADEDNGDICRECGARGEEE